MMIHFLETEVSLPDILFRYVVLHMARVSCQQRVATLMILINCRLVLFNAKTIFW